MSMELQRFRLAPQQRHLWRLQADGSAFRSQCAVLLEGEVEPEPLRAALAAAVLRHDVLRASFRRSPGVRFPFQVIPESAVPPQWQTADLAERAGEDQRAAVDELFRQAARQRFDFERGPLVHALLATLGPGRHLLLLGAPALCADRASLRQLLRETVEIYGGSAPEEEAVPFTQVADWHNELLAGDESRTGRDFWREQEHPSLRTLRFPGEGSAGTGDFSPEWTEIALAPGTAARVRSLGDRTEVVLLAAWQALLARLTGEREVAAGVVLDGRLQEDFATAVGPFARCVPLPVRVESQLTFRGLLERLSSAWTEAADWQDCFAPDEGERAAAGVAAAFEMAAPGGSWSGRGVRFTLLRQTSCCDRFKVCLAATDHGDEISLELGWDARRFSTEAAQGLAERFRLLLDHLGTAPDAPLSEAEILTSEERRRLIVDANRTAAPYPAEECVHRLFAEQAARTPQGVAVESGGERLSYAELAARSHRLARWLAAQGVGPGSVVGVCLERSPELVTAILGTLKAGAAYLPLDSAYPAERIAFMARDAGAAVLLTQERLLPQLADGLAGTRILCLDTVWDQIAAAVGSALPSSLPSESPAYVIYTSGSTGRPKGVVVSHRALLNYLTWAIGAYEAREGRGAPLHSPIGFDLTVTSLLVPLLTGGAVTLVPDDRGVEALAALLHNERGFSLLKLTPAHLALLVEALAGTELEGRTGALVLGGEALLGEPLAAWRERLAGTRIFNEYGPTEATVGCVVHEVPAGAPLTGPVPIGRPIANTRVYLLDGGLRPVPEGVPGEIHLGGASLAQGYLGRPDLTAERFLPDPFAADVGEPGARVYRTGDLARWLPGGDLEYLGRNDSQVKVRGVRIELGEIEAVLAGHPGVREAAVLAREDAPGDRRLVAYVVPGSEPAPNVDELRRFAAARLPDTMVPAAWLTLPSLPLTANGKVDRAVLPAPGSQRPDLEREYVAPRTPVEEILAGVWQEVLGLDRIGVLDSFFALGGDSIRSVRVVALAREQGLEITVEQLFRRQTIAALAEDFPGSVPNEDEELARLVAQLEELSEEEAQERLREHLRAPRAGGAVGP